MIFYAFISFVIIIKYRKNYKREIFIDKWIERTQIYFKKLFTFQIKRIRNDYWNSFV